MPGEREQRVQDSSEGPAEQLSAATPLSDAPPTPAAPVREIGGPKGPEPTRYGDWERAGRCIDF